jgi:hypothetical protein
VSSVLELEPLVSASVEDSVDRVGPVIQHHLFGRKDDRASLTRLR